MISLKWNNTYIDRIKVLSVIHFHADRFIIVFGRRFFKWLYNLLLTYFRILDTAHPPFLHYFAK